MLPITMSRLADLVIVSVLLVFTLPLMIGIGLAIRFDSPGPVFETELCIGRCGRRFRMLQFRTTAHTRDDAQRMKPKATTGIGAFLRYTRIESLPQLLNVLRGDMSMVERDGRSPSFLE